MIESKPEYLSTDGVYRQSGNLSVIQRIRLQVGITWLASSVAVSLIMTILLQVDQGNITVLDTIDDVHVLTGALKLFFRELKVRPPHFYPLH